MDSRGTLSTRQVIEKEVSAKGIEPMVFLQNWMQSILASMGIHTWEQGADLLTSNEHSLPMRQHRAETVLNRTFFFASAFAVLTPAWIIIDWLFLPWPVWGELALLRFASGFGFFLIAWRCRKNPNLWRARLFLALMLFMPTLFFLISQPMLSGYELTGAQSAAAAVYGLLPFVMAAGLSLFPLTLREFVLYAVPMISVTLYTTISSEVVDIYGAVSTIWLFLLILGVALFSALNQLRYMISQSSRASYDELTGVLTRRAGIEAMELQFRLSNLRDDNITVAFLDLDNFKSLNDTFGHKAGDDALKGASAQLAETVRKGDSVIRWGGEEFIIILPGAGCQEGRIVIKRLMDAGLGGRPDGSPLTASIGVSELFTDDIKDWKALVELADQRMYQAKQSGRARSVDCKGEPLLWDTKE